MNIKHIRAPHQAVAFQQLFFFGAALAVWLTFLKLLHSLGLRTSYYIRRPRALTTSLVQRIFLAYGIFVYIKLLVCDRCQVGWVCVMSSCTHLRRTPSVNTHMCVCVCMWPIRPKIQRIRSECVVASLIWHTHTINFNENFHQSRDAVDSFGESDFERRPRYHLFLSPIPCSRSDCRVVVVVVFIISTRRRISIFNQSHIYTRTYIYSVCVCV